MYGRVQPRPFLYTLQSTITDVVTIFAEGASPLRTKFFTPNIIPSLYDFSCKAKSPFGQMTTPCHFSGIIMPMNENATSGKQIRLTSLASCAG
ncbi:MAG: hypothetical protein AAGU15_07040 [Anaerolineaceae bacterium]|jgi:hypothetical protein